MAKRRGGDAPGILAISLFILLADGAYTLRIAHGGTPYLALLFLVALAAALLLPIAVRTGSVLTVRRLRLLPFTHAQFVCLRLVVADPARLLACLIVLGWGIVGVLLLPVGVGARIAGAAQMTAGVVGALMLVSVLEDSLGRALPALFYLVAMFISLIAAQLLVTFGDAWAEVSAAPGQFLRTIGAMTAFGLSLSPVRRVADVAVSIAVCGLLFVIARVVIGRALLPSKAPAVTRADSALISRIAKRLAPRHAAAAAVAIAMFYRVYTTRSGWVLTGAFAAAGFFLPAPELLVGTFLFWAVFSHNMLGPDLPYGGLLRFSLMQYPPMRAVRIRRWVLLISVTGLVVSAAILAAITRGWHGLMTHALAFLFAAGWFGVASIGGDLISQRYPKPIAVRAFMMRDGYVRPVAWLSLAATGVGVGILCVAAYFLSRFIVPASSVPTQVLLAYAIATTSMIFVAGAAGKWGWE